MCNKWELESWPSWCNMQGSGYVRILMIGMVWNFQRVAQIYLLFCPPSVDCGPPTPPRNGSLENYTDSTEGSVVSYSCDPGLVPEGRMTALCTGNRWSPNPADLYCTLGMFGSWYKLNSIVICASNACQPSSFVCHKYFHHATPLCMGTWCYSHQQWICMLR